MENDIKGEIKQHSSTSEEVTAEGEVPSRLSQGASGEGENRTENEVYLV